MRAHQRCRQSERAALAALDADPEQPHPAAVGRPAGGIEQRHRLVDRLQPAAVVQPRAGRRGVAEPGVQRGIPAEIALPGVVGAVVDHPDDPVGSRATDQPPRSTDRPQGVLALDRQRLLGGRPDRVVGGQREPEQSLRGPVRGPRSGVGLGQPGPRPVPAQGEQPPLVGDVVVAEVADDRGCGPSQGTRRHRGHLGERADPERRCRGEPVDQAAPLQQRRAVTAHQVQRVEQEPVEQLDVPGPAGRGQVVGGPHPGPQARVQVQRPTGVVVEGPLRPIGQPAVRPDERVVGGEIRQHVVAGPGAAHRTQERLDHQPEPDPVDPRVRRVADRRSEVVHQPGAGHRVQALPEPGPGQVEDQRDRCRLHLRLRVLVQPHPAFRGSRIDSGADALGVPAGEVVRILAALPRQAESGDQEGPGEPLQAVDGTAVPTLGTGQGDPGVMRRGERPDGGHQPIGEPGPGRAVGRHPWPRRRSARSRRPGPRTTEIVHT